VPAETQTRAVEIMLEKLEVVRQILHGFDYSSFFNAEVKDKLSIILRAEDFILSDDDKKRVLLRSNPLNDKSGHL